MATAQEMCEFLVKKLNLDITPEKLFDTSSLSDIIGVYMEFNPIKTKPQNPVDGDRWENKVYHPEHGWVVLF